MPGFIITEARSLASGGDARYGAVNSDEKETTVGLGAYEARVRLPRRPSDFCVVDTEHFKAFLAGVVLNGQSLCTRSGVMDLPNYIRVQLSDGDPEFFKSLRGVFSGAVYSKSDSSLTVYTNHQGDSPVFYARDANGKPVIASQIDYLLPYLGQAGRAVDRDAVYSMLTYGFMASDQTYLEDVRRLLPGKCLNVLGNVMTVSAYHRFRRDHYDLDGESLGDLVDGLDDRFRAAVEREFSWDQMHDKDHLVDLSGGLDSRMTTWVAHDLGYKPIVNIAYSQSNYLDLEIATEIAAALGTQLYVRTLDDASFLYEAELVTQMNYGLALYAGITGGRQVLQSINLDRFGLEHTGQLGGIIVGSFLKGDVDDGSPRLSGMYSSRLADKLDTSHLREFDSQEVYLLYQRGFNGTLGSHLIRRHYIDAVSPFLDVDFLEFCFSVPLRFRSSRELYRQWIVRKYPDAAKFRWEKTNARVDASRLTYALRRAAKSGPAALERALRLPPRRGGLGRSMNPFDYWVMVHPDIAKYMSRTFYDALSECNFDNELENDVVAFYQSGDVLERVQAVTAVLGARFALS